MYPGYPLEEEDRLRNTWIRQHFLTHLYTFADMRKLKKSASLENVQDFLNRNEFLFLAYNKDLQKKMFGLVQDGTKPIDNILEELESLALQLKTISEKELAQEPLTDEEYELIRSFGGQLEHFWLEALKDEGIDHRSAIIDNPAALIADVATNPDGQVLEEGLGYVSNIYAVVPVDGTLRIAKGAVYSYYEFPWPLEDRLTDDKWKAMLENGEAPERPFWTRVYTAPEGSSQW